MCITTRKERENDRLKAILPSKVNIAQMQELFPPQSPENRGREIRYVYGIIQKAYWINDKKIGTFDYKKNNMLIKNYFKQFKNEL